MKTLTKINIHHSINFRSHRKYLINDPIMDELKWFYKGHKSYSIDEMSAAHFPNTHYSIYSNLYGKNHSKYKNDDYYANH